MHMVASNFLTFTFARCFGCLQLCQGEGAIVCEKCKPLEDAPPSSRCEIEGLHRSPITTLAISARTMSALVRREGPGGQDAHLLMKEQTFFGCILSVRALAERRNDLSRPKQTETNISSTNSFSQQNTNIRQTKLLILVFLPTPMAPTPLKKRSPQVSGPSDRRSGVSVYIPRDKSSVAIYQAPPSNSPWILLSLDLALAARQLTRPAPASLAVPSFFLLVQRELVVLLPALGEGEKEKEAAPTRDRKHSRIFGEGRGRRG